LTAGVVVGLTIVSFFIGLIIGLARRKPSVSESDPQWEPIRTVIRTQMLQQGIPQQQVDDILHRMDISTKLRQEVLSKLGIPLERVPQAPDQSNRPSKMTTGGVIAFPLPLWFVSWKLLVPGYAGVLGYFIGRARR
jgi:hypothetical protein